MQEIFTTPVVSQTRPFGWTITIVGAIINFALIVVFIVAFSVYYRAFSWVELSGGAIALAVWMYYSFNATVRSAIRLTVGRDGIEVLYLLTHRKWMINYPDIVHVESVIANGNSYRTEVSTFLRLEIYLRNGEQFAFTDAQFANYRELKDAIRFFRFHGDEVTLVNSTNI